MHRYIAGTLCASLFAAAPLVARAHEPGPHQHGVARLEVAVDGAVLSLFLDSPLDNLLGFEHYPRTAQQRAAVHALGARLRNAASVFVPTAAARCASTLVKLDSPVFEPKSPNADGSGGHADLEAEYVFRCDLPNGLHGVEVKLFKGFPNMRRIDVQVAGPRGQFGAALDASNRSVTW